MPGSSAEFALELDPHVATESEITSKEVKSFEWRPIPLARLAKVSCLSLLVLVIHGVRPQ